MNNLSQLAFFAPVKQTVLNNDVAIDYRHYIEERKDVLRLHHDVGAYLLLPEILTLIEHAPHQDAYAIMYTLFATGARINEALALRPMDFEFDRPLGGDAVIISTLKARENRRQKRAKKRMIFLQSDGPHDYAPTMKRYLKGKPARETIWKITDRTVNNWISKAAQNMRDRGLDLPDYFNISAHNFRHSFAVNLLMQQTQFLAIQHAMGHSDPKHTLPYLKVFLPHIAHLQAHVKTSMPGDEIKAALQSPLQLKQHPATNILE